jgi:serine phosphatase RsbU (regulator of sigma subunit)
VAGEDWAIIRYEPIAGPDDTVIFGVTTVDDITSIKRAEFTTRVLAETAGLLDSTRDLELTLSKIAEMSVPRFAEFCTVLVPGEEGRLEPAAAAHSDPQRLELIRRLHAEDPIHIDDDRATSRVFRERRPILLEIDDQYLNRIADRRASLLRRLDFGSVLIVPLVAGTKVVGVVSYANQRGSRRFDATDAALGAEIGDRAGLALQSARLAAEEAEVAKLLQLGLRPTAFPATRGWNLASMYRSAGEVTEVGGDFYDAFPVDGGWVVAIGDVVGRGAGAASLTALARHTLRTATRFTNDTNEALQRLHEAFAEEVDQLCSVAVVLLPDSEGDPAEVSVLSAGHPLPLHCSAADREVREVGVPGPLLGVFESARWPMERISLQAGDQLILYTDGVPEAKGRAGRFGAERLRASVAGATDPASAVRQVELALDEFCPYGSQDDAALVAIQRLPTLVRTPTARRRGETSRHIGPRADPAAR